ncbi:MAG TPA: hypothetical protein VNW06_08975 [Cytophagaceae bacterium]|jgi:hypothetical protein|nr:hypothetical protein [Cytophagaceae bacterium]
MKSTSIKIILLTIVLGTLINACKKVNDPAPSTKDLLIVKTWTLTSYKTSPSGAVTTITDAQDALCQGLVFQFPNTGIYNQGAGCSLPLYSGTWTITDQTVTLNSGVNGVYNESPSTLTITSISSTNMSATLSYKTTTYYAMQFKAE